MTETVQIIERYPENTNRNNHSRRLLWRQLIDILDLTDNLEKIVDFVNTVKPTIGGDEPEAYELVLHEASKLSGVKILPKLWL